MYAMSLMYVDSEEVAEATIDEPFTTTLRKKLKGT